MEVRHLHWQLALAADQYAHDLERLEPAARRRDYDGLLTAKFLMPHAAVHELRLMVWAIGKRGYRIGDV